LPKYGRTLADTSSWSLYKVGEITSEGSGGPIFKEGCKLASGGRTDYYYLFDSIKYPTLNFPKAYFQQLVVRHEKKKMFKKGFMGYKSVSLHPQ
jgi:hypothetical protein